MVESTPSSRLSSFMGRLVQSSQFNKRLQVPSADESGSHIDYQAVSPGPVLEEHYPVFFLFLFDYLKKRSQHELRHYIERITSSTRTRPRQKLACLSAQQFYELSVDICEELVRRQDKRQERNMARQKLATLTASSFDDLSSDVYFELLRRYPELREDEKAMEKEGQRIMSWNKNSAEVSAYLGIIFGQVKYYKTLLSFGEVESQRVLDTFQQLLDNGNYHQRTQLIAAMRRLSERKNLYPACFFCKGPKPASEDFPVASGSFADIYKVTWQGKDICYKVLRVSQQSLAKHITKAYAREAILWGQLSHPNILPFYGLSQFQSRPSLVSCWARHGSIINYLTKNPDANRILLCSDTAAGVEYLHRNDIVHGDLKGVNVLVSDSGRACLGDFGLSSVTDPQIIKWTSQSTMASKGGTIRWQAPELLLSEDNVETVYNSKESDVYAWANVCYEIFTGFHPFFEVLRESSVMLLVMRGVTPTRPTRDQPAWLRHGLNDQIWSLMTDCWRFQPSQRPDITTVVSTIEKMKPADSRPPQDWAGKRDLTSPNDDSGQVWEELNDILSRVIKDTSAGEPRIQVRHKSPSPKYTDDITKNRNSGKNTSLVHSLILDR